MAITILGKDVTNISIDEKEVIRISDYLTGDIIFEKVPVNYFYIQNTYSGTNTITITSTSDGNPSEDCFTRVIEYSRDRRIWTAVALAHQVQTTITLNQNDKVYFRNSNGKLNYDNTVEYFYTTFTASESHIVGGNIESLVDYRYIGRINYRFQGTYSSLFRDNTTLTSASGLIMPENNLSAKCMSDMFRGCTALEDAPELPAKTLSKSCYLRMFAECSSLTETPELPATSVQDGVYWSMFRNCTSLVTTHDLELKVLTNDCYNNMFYGCTSLVDAPEIYAQVYGKNSCENMFRSCTSLSSMQVNVDDATATDCTKNWLANVAPTGVFVNDGGFTFQYPSPSGVPQGWLYNPMNYFYIENKYNGTNTITLTTQNSGGNNHHATALEYSKDRLNWSEITLSGTNTISMNSGEKVYFRNTNGYFNERDFYTIFSANKNHNVGGNIMSIIDYTNIGSATLSEYCFFSMFENDTYLKDASNLLMYQDVLQPSCYSYMFSGCSRLVTPPALQATTVAPYCYQRMFQSCTALTSAPALPATTLAVACYYWMFQNCTSLTTAPELPATTLATGCYRGMFGGCTRMTSVPSELPATTLETNCYYDMFSGCYALTSAPIIKATTLAEDCCYQMFNGCSSITTAPTLLATTLEDGCYYNMFRNCSSLTSLTSYADDITATDCLYNWMYGVSATGTFHNLGSATYSTGASGIPSGWTEVNS